MYHGAEPRLPYDLDSTSTICCPLIEHFKIKILRKFREKVTLFRVVGEAEKRVFAIISTEGFEPEHRRFRLARLGGVPLMHSLQGSGTRFQLCRKY